MNNSLTMLVEYKAWANGLVYDMLSEVPNEELVAERKIVFGSILRTLNHTYLMDLVWKSHLTGESHNLTTRNPKECPSFAVLRSAQRNTDNWFANYISDLKTNEYDDLVEFTFIGGGKSSMTRASIVLHVVNHATYHRGHIADMIYQIPEKPPTTDLPVFLRQRRI